MNFLFTKGQRVKVKATGEVGTVEHCDTDPTTNVPFYRVRLADGTVILIAESDMPRVVVVLGTSHQLQGIEKLPGSLCDPHYNDLVELLISRHHIDCIFEEASGLGPTTAKQLPQQRAQELAEELAQLQSIGSSGGASDLDQIAAQELARELARVQSIRYFDIDPHKDDRHKFGIAKETKCVEYIDENARDGPREPFDRLKVGEHAKREALWLCKILEQDFKNGLVICGSSHTLSFAFRLQSAGFETEAYYYMPHHKLSVLAVPPGTADGTK